MSNLTEIIRRLVALEEFARKPRAETPISGVWTPTYLGGTIPGATTYTVQVGQYTLNGNVCLYSYHVAWTAATGTGNAQISLPFTAANATNIFFTASAWYNNVTYAGTGVLPLISPNTGFSIFTTPTSNAPVATLAIEAAGQMVVTGFYFV